MEKADETQRRRFVAKTILAAELDGIEVIVDAMNNVSIRGKGEKVAAWSPILTMYTRDVAILMSHSWRITVGLMNRLVDYKPERGK